MSQTVFLGPEDTPRVTSIGRWAHKRLPPDLEEEAVRRIAGLSGAAFCASIASFVAFQVFPGLLSGVREPRLGVAASFMLLSLSLCVVARRRLLPAHRIVDLSLGYKILGAAAMSIVVNSQAWPKEQVPIGWSPVAVWVLMFPIIVPGPTARTLFTSTVASLTEPAGLWLLIHLGKVEAPSSDVLARRFFPTVIALFLSVFVSHIVFDLGRQLSAARELGSYRLVERLGSGGMGEVWRAKHRMLARPAAVKLIHPEVFQGQATSSGNAKLRFEREAQATAALRSPHTIGIFDFGVARDGTFYYVMELLEGMDLDSLVKRHGPQPPARVVHLLRQACHSLHEAHKAGLVHRDIKPANLFVCRYGADLDFVKVLDFGLVAERRADKAQPALTAENALTGTPAFMPPEVVTEEQAVDGRADLYALGCVAYWLLTGELVFEGETAMKVVLLHATATPVAPSRRAAGAIPAELDRIVLDCLEKEPERRPQSARELSARLEGLGLGEEWTEAHAARWWDEAGRDGAARVSSRGGAGQTSRLLAEG
jgi:eukaryotic-like serine/threonine-protein kinase